MNLLKKAFNSDILNESPLHQTLKGDLELLMKEKYLDDLYNRFKEMYAPNVEVEGLTEQEIDDKLGILLRDKGIIKVTNKEEFDLYRRNDGIGREFFDNMKDLKYFLDDFSDNAFNIDKCKILFRNGETILYESKNSNQVNYDINFEIPKSIVLPDDMKLFYQKFNGLELKNLTKDETKFLSLDKITHWNPVVIFNPDEDLLVGYYDKKEIAKINLNDWFKFYFDGISTCNGCGSLVINLNPDSSCFGNILSYSSGDEGIINFVAQSFSEMIQLLIDISFKNIIQYDEICCSLCDHLNNICDCLNNWNNPNHNKLLFSDEKSEYYRSKYLY